MRLITHLIPPNEKANEGIALPKLRWQFPAGTVFEAIDYTKQIVTVRVPFPTAFEQCESNY